MKILVVCTGNSCRSQMAEGILKSLRPDIKVFSAGVKPEKEISPYAIKVMKEKEIDISINKPKDVQIFENDIFDFLIPFSESAKNKCKSLNFKVKNVLHFDFDDPFEATGSEKEIIIEYRKVRDDIFKKLKDFIIYV